MVQLPPHVPTQQLLARLLAAEDEYRRLAMEVAQVLSEHLRAGESLLISNTEEGPVLEVVDLEVEEPPQAVEPEEVEEEPLEEPEPVEEIEPEVPQEPASAESLEALVRSANQGGMHELSKTRATSPRHRPMPPKPPTAELLLSRLVEVLAEEPRNPDRIRDALARAVGQTLRKDDPRLLDLVEGIPEVLQGDRRMRPLRRALRAREKSRQRGSERVVEVWEHQELTRGWRVLVVGGDKRTDVAERYKECFGFAEVVWDTGWRKERVAAHAEQVAQGSFELVIIVRDFVKHMATDALVPAAKGAGVPFAVVDRGYGVGQVRQAMERVLLG